MFRLVRFFLVTSVFAVSAIAIAFFLYRQSEVERLVVLAERQNVELARSFANTIWPRFAIYAGSGSSLEQGIGRARREAISQAVGRASAGLPVLKVKIYDLDGLTVYSTNPDEIGEYKATNPGFFSAAREGTPASKLTFRHRLSSFEGTVQERDLVESYLPIREDNGPVLGVFELYTDVTPLMDAIGRSTNTLVIGFLPIFALSYGMLFLIVRRADRTIKRQYADITEKNFSLQREVGERARAEAALTQAHDELEKRVEERTRELTEEIAERRRAEEEARRHRGQLAHFGRVSMIGEMATGLAHELNQPLTVISGCVQFCVNALRSGVGNSEKLLDAMAQAAEQADRANKIVRRVRGFIHKEEPERQLVDVNEVIRDISGLLRWDASEHDVEIQLDLALSTSPVSADPIQIQQVILNLAHNGMEAISDGQPESHLLRIETRDARTGVLEVAVHDQGRGLPAAILEDMFDPFFTTKSHGLGMGLSISRTIVEAHGGRLWATSNPSEGTIFRFTLPTAEGSTHDAI